jgi:hypothetical protein
MPPAQRAFLQSPETLQCVEIGAGRDLAYTGEWLRYLPRGSRASVQVDVVDPDIDPNAAAVAGRISSIQEMHDHARIHAMGMRWDEYATLVDARDGRVPHLIIGVQALPVFCEPEFDQFFAAAARCLPDGGLLVLIHEPEDEITQESNRRYAVHSRTIKRHWDTAIRHGLHPVGHGVVLPAHRSPEGHVTDGNYMAGMVLAKQPRGCDEQRAKDARARSAVIPAVRIARGHAGRQQPFPAPVEH